MSYPALPTVSIRWCHHDGDGFNLNIERLDVAYPTENWQYVGWVGCSINNKLETRENYVVDGRARRVFPCTTCSNKRCKSKVFTVKSKPILLYAESEI